jgi:hypothetical protein
MTRLRGLCAKVTAGAPFRCGPNIFSKMEQLKPSRNSLGEPIHRRQIMRKLVFTCVAAALVTAPLASVVKAEDTTVIKRDRDEDTTVIKRR